MFIDDTVLIVALMDWSLSRKDSKEEINNFMNDLKKDKETNETKYNT